MDWALIACVLLILNGIFILLCFARLDSNMKSELLGLDEKIAGALRSLVAEGLGDFEPINPIQAAIAEFIKTRMGEENPGLKTITRAADGKFKTENQ